MYKKSGMFEHVTIKQSCEKMTIKMVNYEN